MLRTQLKSKLHRACITDANVQYEGSISIDTELMAQADLWAGEKVTVASIDSGERLETYVQPGEKGAARIVINGGAAHTIGAGERVTIMAYGWAEERINARKLLLDEDNEVIRTVVE